jgi:hypothetical protein
MERSKVPSAYNALRRQLGAATDGATRDRLERAITYVRRLYGLPESPPHHDDGDLRRRNFARSPHRIIPRERERRM